jgi:hypothetical protein
MDLSSLNLFIKYLRNPLRFFGKVGFWFLLFGFICIGWVGYRLGVDHLPWSEMNVLITLVFLLLVAGFQFFFLGLVARLIVGTGERKGKTMTPWVSQENEVQDG